MSGARGGSTDCGPPSGLVLEWARWGNVAGVGTLRGGEWTRGRATSARRLPSSTLGAGGIPGTRPGSGPGSGASSSPVVCPSATALSVLVARDSWGLFRWSSGSTVLPAETPRPPSVLTQCIPVPGRERRGEGERVPGPEAGSSGSYPPRVVERLLGDPCPEPGGWGTGGRVKE